MRVTSGRFPDNHVSSQGSQLNRYPLSLNEEPKMITLDKLIVGACAIGWLMVLLPSLVYLGTEWRARRERMFGALNEEALKLYFQQFFPSVHVIHPTKQFAKGFGRLYGIRQYLLPLVLLALTSAIGMWITAMTIRGWLGLISNPPSLSPIVISAFLGAYAWVLVDQLGRYQSRDFTKHNIYDGIYRFLIAVPLGFSFAAFFKPEMGVPLAFLLGSFPTQTLIKFSRRLVVEKYGLGEKEEDGPTELAKLQGIGRENAERFQNIDITTIVQLAWADPIDVTIRTNFEFSFVIDAISQALMWIYFEDDTRKLYRNAFRGAQEVRWLLNRLESDEEEIKAKAKKTIQDGAAVLQMDAVTFMNTLDAISVDPYTSFLCSIWSPTTTSDAAEDADPSTAAVPQAPSQSTTALPGTTQATTVVSSNQPTTPLAITPQSPSGTTDQPSAPKNNHS
jgi:hypothetical protein